MINEPVEDKQIIYALVELITQFANKHLIIWVS
jgi:hypothetical protein